MGSTQVDTVVVKLGHSMNFSWLGCSDIKEKTDLVLPTMSLTRLNHSGGSSSSSWKLGGLWRAKPTDDTVGYPPTLGLLYLTPLPFRLYKTQPMNSNNNTQFMSKNLLPELFLCL